MSSQKETAPRHPLISTSNFDRATEKRDDEAWIAAEHRQPQTRYVPLWRNRCLVKLATDKLQQLTSSSTLSGKAIFLAHDQIHPLDDSPHPPTLLGRDGAVTYFGVSVGDAMASMLSEQHDAQFSDLRQVIDHLGQMESSLLAYAKAMHYWQHRHRFCGVCGQANQLCSAGHRMRCCNPECGRDTFPRIDPAIIVLVTHKNQDGEACLLGRHPSWPAKRYSTLAGFVEPGESLEQAVHREVFEESGVQLHQVSYQSSQPWPFPASAMAGFRAKALGRRLNINHELEDAIWLTAEDIQRQVKAGELRLPTPYSIAFSLIASWYHEQTGDDPQDLVRT